MIYLIFLVMFFNPKTERRVRVNMASLKINEDFEYVRPYAECQQERVQIDFECKQNI